MICYWVVEQWLWAERYVPTKHLIEEKKQNTDLSSIAVLLYESTRFVIVQIL
jgi:hypothetical protein